MNDKVKTERIGERSKMLLGTASSLPRTPGCYLMKNSKGQVIYVGKAIDLKSRVSSYFNKSKKTPKTEILVSHIREFDFILTGTDTEAFVLENNLIKKHAPKYNIRLRDDKSYPYVLVDHSEPFPRVKYVRRFKRGRGKEVFGPFVVGSNISEVLRIITKSFSLRDCSLREYKSRKVPCLLYQMSQCSAPCVGYIDENEYEKDLKNALNLFRGKGVNSLKVLKKNMEKNADDENFEKAAMLRDNIFILEEFLEISKQKNVELSGNQKNIDIISVFIGELEVDISMYILRNGILLGQKNFHFPVIEMNEELNEELMAFLYQYYVGSNDLPPDFIISTLDNKQCTILEESLDLYFSSDDCKKKFSNDFEYKKKIKVQKPGKKFASLHDLTAKHAKEKQRFRLSNEESVFIGLNKLKELLGLKERPIVLECYDVAIFQGSSPTASQIVFYDGAPVKESYRHYHLEERPEGNNDFAMMREVLDRRVKKGKLPDVFIVDGGKGQVSAFLGVLKDKKISIPVVGIAKSKSKNGTRSEERLIIPGRVNPYILKKNKSLLNIIVNMRDEAHRFSRVLHHKTEKKKLVKSWLDEVPGIGPKTREKILKKMDKTQEEIMDMGMFEIKDYFKITEKIANNILTFCRYQDEKK